MLSVINAVPSSVYVVNARWRIFCHVLRMKENVLARHEMTCYFNEKSHKLRQGIFLLRLFLLMSIRLLSKRVHRD